MYQKSGERTKRGITAVQTAGHDKRSDAANFDTQGQRLEVNKEFHLTAHMVEMAQWELAPEAHALMDGHYSARIITLFYLKHGMPTNESEVYDYITVRRRAMAQSMTMEQLIASYCRQPIIDDAEAAAILQQHEVTTQLMNDVDALDYMIGKGFQQMHDPSVFISPTTVMQAINLKYKLTGGALGGFTNSGIAELREIESKKFQLLSSHMMKYIPEELRQRVLGELLSLEEQFYANTRYYEMYLRSRQDLTPAEVESRLDMWRTTRMEQQNVAVQEKLQLSHQIRTREPDQNLIQSFLDTQSKATTDKNRERRQTMAALMNVNNIVACKPGCSWDKLSDRSKTLAMAALTDTTISMSDEVRAYIQRQKDQASCGGTIACMTTERDDNGRILPKNK